jgi:hypothetical protein
VRNTCVFIVQTIVVVISLGYITYFPNVNHNFYRVFYSNIQLIYRALLGYGISGSFIMKMIETYTGEGWNDL